MQRSVQIEHAVFERGLAELEGVFKGELADGFLTVFDDRDVGALVGRLYGTAEGHRATGGCLQAQRYDFQRVRQRQRFVMAAGDQRAHLRKA